MKRALIAASLAFALVNMFWLIWNYVAGSVPSTNELLLWLAKGVDGENVRTIGTNPFAVSRIPFDGIFAGFLAFIAHLVATNKTQGTADHLVFGLVSGLVFGLVFGLV